MVPELERLGNQRSGCLARINERNGFSLRVVEENEAARAEAQRASEDVFPAFARPESIATATIVRNALGKTPRY